MNTRLFWAVSSVGRASRLHRACPSFMSLGNPH